MEGPPGIVSLWGKAGESCWRLKYVSFVFMVEVRIPESDGGSLSGSVPSMKDGSCR